MLDTKTWWQSRTIWVQIVSALFALAAAFHILPAGLDQEQVVGAIMGAVAIVTLFLRIYSTHAIVRPQIPEAIRQAGDKVAAIGLSLLIPALLVMSSLSACATTRQSAPVDRLTQISADFAQARAFAAPFLAWLPPERAALVRAVADMVEQALAVARSASSAQERDQALRAAAEGTADYRFATGG